jgi:hypothetical protein
MTCTICHTPIVQSAEQNNLGSVSAGLPSTQQVLCKACHQRYVTDPGLEVSDFWEAWRRVKAQRAAEDALGGAPPALLEVKEQCPQF